MTSRNGASRLLPKRMIPVLPAHMVPKQLNKIPLMERLAMLDSRDLDLDKENNSREGKEEEEEEEEEEESGQVQEIDQEEEDNEDEEDEVPSFIVVDEDDSSSDDPESHHRSPLLQSNTSFIDDMDYLSIRTYRRSNAIDDNDRLEDDLMPETDTAPRVRWSLAVFSPQDELSDMTQRMSLVTDWKMATSCERRSLSSLQRASMVDSQQLVVGETTAYRAISRHSRLAVVKQNQLRREQQQLTADSLGFFKARHKSHKS